MKFWALAISASAHCLALVVYWHRPQGFVATPIWIEKGGAPIAFVSSRLKSNTAALSKMDSVAEKPDAAVSGTGGSTIHSTVDQWTAWGNSPPEYPYQAQRKGWQGRVDVRITVAPNQPSRVVLESSSGHSILDEAALIWARNARVSVPKETNYLVPIVFRLANTQDSLGRGTP